MKRNSHSLAILRMCLAWAVASPILHLQAGASPALDLARQLNQAFAEVVAEASPSVVVVEVARKRGYHHSQNMQDSFWDLLPEEFREQFRRQFPDEPEGQPSLPPGRNPIYDARGSGVIIRREGFILTNRHVVDDAESIRIKLQDGREYIATIQGEDVQSDIAVLKIEADELPAIKIGDSDKARVGEFAIAIGTPFDLDYSVTFGHISAKGRSRIIPDITMDQDFIQTDANINPGNSGGPLVNIEGEIIGVNTLIRGLRSGIGFAVPINLAMEVAERLIEHGKYVRSWLGIRIESLRDHREYRTLVEGIDDGIVVTMILTNGPAGQSDLKANDIITAVDGVTVKTTTDLKAAIRAKPAGQNITLDVHRLMPAKGSDFTGENIQIQLAPQPMPDTLLATISEPAEPAPPQTAEILGMTVEPLSEELAKQYGAGDTEGVIVTEVESGSEASLKGVRPGDIITEVNQAPVKSPEEFMQSMGEADLQKGVIVNFTSRGTSRFLILKESGD